VLDAILLTHAHADHLSFQTGCGVVTWDDPNQALRRVASRVLQERRHE
jgi:L-ascorbate metabolism protein UlaG (beta-lactamase superfamily)